MDAAVVPSLSSFPLPAGGEGRFHSVALLERAGLGRVSRLPLGLRVILESLARNADGVRVRFEDVAALAAWQADGPREGEIPFVVARIVAPDSSGIPLLADIAAMREAAAALGVDPARIEPSARLDFIVDHSVQVDHARRPDALRLNMQLEAVRNRERYAFIKWAAGAFGGVTVVPPGAGIIHQVNMERWAPGVHEQGGVYFPDTLVGADSHTAMINGLGVVGWGVGGIEAEAAMLGQPTYLPVPDVIGVELTGRPRPGVTATDLVLSLTQFLREAGVVSQFVEFFGEGVEALSAPDRATLANMAPEYGATLAYFPVDEQTLAYYRHTGRGEAQVALLRAYFQAQGWFGVPRRGDIDYTRTLAFALDGVGASVAGPRRPQDRLDLAALPAQMARLYGASPEEGGFGRAKLEPPSGERLGDGSIVLAAITSCTNTANPGVMVTAGLLARNALARGLSVPSHIKTSLAPGSRAVPEYLRRAGLLEPLAKLGFELAGFGCTTCVGNAGPLEAALERDIVTRGLVVAAVLSGNRNFEARIHPAIRANFLMSPPLVVAFAIAGRVDLDLTREPLGTGSDGRPVMLSDLWPGPAEIAQAMKHAQDPGVFHAAGLSGEEDRELWSAIPSATGPLFAWDERSDYLRRPPFLEGMTREAAPVKAVRGARALLILGDSVTTDHISPGGAFAPDSPAGRFLRERGTQPADFNTYIGRRGNHEVMVRGTFANVRLRNLLAPGTQGGLTRHWPDGGRMSVHEAATAYRAEGVPLIVFAGAEYGTGSSRDWAAKGTALLGVRAVIAQSFERIHRANLVGMGVLPLEFLPGEGVGALGIFGHEVFDLEGLEGGLSPGQSIELVIHHAIGATRRVRLRCRLDTPIEARYFAHGGILPYVLRGILAADEGTRA